MHESSEHHDSEQLAALMSSLHAPDDRRDEPRFACSYTVEFEGQPARGVVTEISRAGMRIRLAPDNYAPDNYITDVQDLRCWIWIQGGILKLQGHIVRVGTQREICMRFAVDYRSLVRSRLCAYVPGVSNDLKVLTAGTPRKAIAVPRAQRALTRGLRLEDGHLVVKERGLAELGIRQAAKKAAEEARKAEAGANEAAEREAAEAAAKAAKPAGVSTMRRGRDASLLDFWTRLRK